MPDVAKKCIAANPEKFAGITCSTQVTGVSSKKAETYATPVAPSASGLEVRYDNRFDDKTYYST